VVVGANSAAKYAQELALGPDALLFTDHNWFEDNEEWVRGFGGLRFTLSRASSNECPELLRLENSWMEEFKPQGVGPLRDGRSSGHRIVSLSVMLGAKYVLLLGFDMRLVDGRSHYHNEYHNNENGRLYQDEFIASFGGWYNDALRVGCEILNATPNSALEEFPQISLEKFLQIKE